MALVWLEHDGWWKKVDLAPDLLRRGKVVLDFMLPLKIVPPDEEVPISTPVYAVVFFRLWEARRDGLPIFSSSK